MSEVANELSVSKGTVMHHFGSKDRMLAEMSLGYMERRLQELLVVKAAYPDPVDQLAGLILSLITAFRDDPNATRAFSREFIRFVEDPVMDEVRALRRRYTIEVDEIISRGIASGQIATDLPHIVGLQILGMCNWSWTWIDPDGATSVEDIAAVYANSILNGLRTEKERLSPVFLPDEIIEARSAARGQ